jgi:anti-sigma28 factor (negative regulator of flagellin synthesis)
MDVKIAPTDLLSALSPAELLGCAPGEPVEGVQGKDAISLQEISKVKKLLSETAPGGEIDSRLLASIQDQLGKGEFAVPEEDVADAMLEDAHFLERWLK